MCDQVAQIQENILCVKEERRFLFKKLLEHDDDLLVEAEMMRTKADPTSGPLQALKKTKKKRSNSEMSGKSRNSTSNKSTKSTSAASKRKQQTIQTISVDESGCPIYPITMSNSLSLYDLGTIIHDRPGYNTENWIYPAGYISTRIYGHMMEPGRKCVYTCKIVECGDFPRFANTL